MKREMTFFNTMAGILPVAALLLAMLALGVFANQFFSVANAQVVWSQTVMMAMVACAIAISVRAQGPDLSILPVMGLCMWIAGMLMQEYGIEAGMIAAILVGTGIGALNAVAIKHIRLPAWAVTLIVGIVIGVICTFLQYQLIQNLPPPLLGRMPVVIAVALVAALVLVFLFVLFTPLGVPFTQRKREEKPKAYFFAYLVSGALAALAGCAWCLRLRVVMPPTAFSFENILFLLFVAAALYASKLFDNRMFPVLYALLLAFVWCAIGNVTALLGVSSYLQIIIRLLITSGMVILSCFTSEWRKRKSVLVC